MSLRSLVIARSLPVGECGGYSRVVKELPDRKPEIEYPTRWGYRVIGPDAQAVRAAVGEVLAGLEFELEESHRSPGGKYQAFAVQLVVRDEEERLGLFEAFKRHPAIVYVL